MNVGSFKSSQDYQDQMERYKETLRLQIKNANREAELNRTAWSSNGEFKPQPVAPTMYKSIEEEQADRSLQLQNAQNSLNMIFKYPVDAKKTFDLVMADYDPVEFNKYLPEFLTEIKNVKDITPSLFFNQWERFITIMRSRGDNFVKIGPNDDKTKILLEQQRSGIEKFIKENIDPTVPSLIKSRILYLLKDAVNTADEKKVIEEGKKMLDASRSPLSDQELGQKEQELKAEWLDGNEERFAEMGISRRDIKIPPNVNARIIREASENLVQDRNQQLVKTFIARLRGEKPTEEEETKGEQRIPLIPTEEKITGLKERLQRRFEEKQATRERLAEVSRGFEEFTKELSAEKKTQKEKYEQAQKGIEIINDLQQIARENKFNYNPQEGTINLKKKNINQQADLSIKFLEKIYPMVPVDRKDEVQGVITQLKERPTKQLIKQVLVDMPKGLSQTYKKAPRGPFKFQPSERLQIFKPTEEEEESGFRISTPKISRPKIQMEEKELEPTELMELEPMKPPKQQPEFEKPIGEDIRLREELQKYKLLTAAKKEFVNDKTKIASAYNKLTGEKISKSDITDKNINSFKDKIISSIRQKIQGGEGMKSKKKTRKTKGGFLPLLLASTLLPALTGNGKPKSSKKSSKKIKIISV